MKGKRLRARLRQLDKTQKQFADFVGITQPSLHEWFARGVPPKRVRKAAEFLEMKPEEVRPDIFGP